MPEPLDQALELLKRGMDPALLTYAQEKMMPVSASTTTLKIGVPKENGHQERRVPLTPGAVGVMVACGHEVYVEHNAGLGAQLTDKAYSDAGAIITYTAAELYQRADLIVKIAPLSMAELEITRPRQTLISAVHIGGLRPDYLKGLMERNITAIGFEFLQGTDGSNPILRLLSEIAGVSAIHIASELLTNQHGGKGLLLGGVTGVPPAVVTIVGAGTVGYHAAKTAIGLGALVKVLDGEVYRLKRLEDRLGQKIFTAVTQNDYLREAVASADVLIGAAYRAGARSPIVVTEDQVLSMREGSVVVDISIDQGGCIETSRPTTHEEPTYELNGIIHYCVPNIASRVARTASASISNILGPMVLNIGEAGGVRNLMAINRTFKKGIYIYHKHITQRPIATMFNLDFMDIDLLYAAQM